jgi:hypothetical protein
MHEEESPLPLCLHGLQMGKFTSFLGPNKGEKQTFRHIVAYVINNFQYDSAHITRHKAPSLLRRTYYLGADTLTKTFTAGVQQTLENLTKPGSYIQMGAFNTQDDISYKQMPETRGVNRKENHLTLIHFSNK